ncbi:hypothetical protein GGF46_003094 [Coemansia sp. RSA 552]|nr:hypothetical protein GGF46_003094 [Coemansia sp. RSA 552]
MKWSIQVVKPSTYNDRSTSVMVDFPTGRYLFNCGEGTQRICVENRMRMAKVTGIFLTRVDWENMGGLPGMLLTLADAGTRNLMICGGHNLTHAMAATRHFILRNNMGVATKELRDGDAAAAFNDGNINVAAVHIYPASYTVTARELGPDESDDAQTRQTHLVRAFGVRQEPEAEPRLRRSRKKLVSQQKKKGYYDKPCEGGTIEQELQRIERSEEEEETVKKRTRSFDQDTGARTSWNLLLPTTVPTPAALCYIVEGPTVPGKFDVKAAKALGLQPGPNYAELVQGRSITTADGKTIHSEQCVAPSKPGGVFIIVECPSVDYIHSLTTSTRFDEFLDAPSQAESGRKKQLQVVVHCLGLGVAQDERYKAWAARFPANVHHVVSAPEYAPDSNPFQRHLRVQSELAAINPRVFIQPQSSNTPQLPLSSFLPKAKLVLAEGMTVFDVEPKARLDTSRVQLLLTAEEMRNKQHPDGKGSQLTAAAVTRKRPAAKDDELVVCTIGTGSSLPSVYRNVSSNIVSVKGFGGMVLDCGEATASLLKRFLGHPHRNSYNTRVEQTYQEFMTGLKLVYISHMHADHHLGAIQLLHEWNGFTRDMDPVPRITVLGPSRFWVWLQDYACVQDIGLDRIDFISCNDIRLPETISPTRSQLGNNLSSAVRAKMDALQSGLGLTDVATCSVVHCPWAYGLSLTHQSGWKLVYSGDTRPCVSLVALGRAGDRPPTILLHEATLSDCLLEDAIAKRHSTVSEAVAMGLGMGAENILLTHFSQRCLTLPRWHARNVFNVKVGRYGRLAGKGAAAAAAPMGPANGESLSDVEPAELYMSEDEGIAVDSAPLAGDAIAEREEAARELSEDSDSDTAGPRILDRINVATAYDLAAFGPSDIYNYRHNVHGMKETLSKELALFIAEENPTDTPKKTQNKAAAPRGKGTRKTK